MPQIESIEYSVYDRDHDHLDTFRVHRHGDEEKCKADTIALAKEKGPGHYVERTYSYHPDDEVVFWNE